MKPLQDNVVTNVTFREASEADPEERSELQRDPDDTNFSIIELPSGQRFALRKENRKYQGWLKVLAASPPDDPLYIETEPGTPNVTSILVPLLRSVLYVSAESREGRLQVNVRLSPRVFHLSQELGAEKFNRFRDLIKYSQASGNRVWVTTRPATGEILDVRGAPTNSHEGPAKAGNTLDEDDEDGEPVLLNLAGGCQVEPVEFGTAAFASVTSGLTMAQAVALFNDMASQPHIPFPYVRDCCTARAHEMCRLIGEAGVRTRKVWNYGSGWAEPDKPATLHVVTNAVPEGSVDWTYHVAPTVGVSTSSGTVTRMVIDPSLFSQPVPISEWVERQTDPDSETRRRASNLIWFDYLTDDGFSDPDYLETNKQFESHWAALNDEINS